MSEAVSEIESKPRLPRFSLLTLILLTAILAMGIVIYRQHREVVGLRDMVVDAGFLQVGDEAQYHAIYVPTYDELTWRWRVWLPEGRTYQFGAKCNQVPGQQGPLPPDGEVQRFGADFSYGAKPGLPAGEYIITVAMRKQNDSVGWRLVFEANNLTAGMTATGRLPVNKNGGQWPDGKFGARTVVGSRRGTFSGALDEPFELMRFRTAASSLSSGGPPADGLLIWVEPMP